MIYAKDIIWIFHVKRRHCCSVHGHFLVWNNVIDDIQIYPCSSTIGMDWYLENNTPRQQSFMNEDNGKSQRETREAGEAGEVGGLALVTML